MGQDWIQQLVVNVNTERDAIKIQNTNLKREEHYSTQKDSKDLFDNNF